MTPDRDEINDPGGYAQLAELLRNVCSICFDRRCDFSLPSCQDQFCRPCMSRYLSDCVGTAWGAYGGPRVIKCPSCRDPISTRTWMRYADDATVERYNDFCRPFRSPMRTCQLCRHDNRILPAPIADAADFDNVSDTVLAVLRDELDAGDALCDHMASELHNVKCGTATVLAVYEHIAGALLGDGGAAAGGHTRFAVSESLGAKRRRVGSSARCSALHALEQLTRLERNAERWTALLRTHMRLAVPAHASTCARCSAQLCLQCGEPSWHALQTCEEFLAARAPALDDESRATVAWKLEFGKRCPACAVLICREEGCNKVDCLQCGHEFCWACRRPWSKDCGFFRCRDGDVEAGDEQASDAGKQSKTENGVPNADAVTQRVAQRVDARRAATKRAARKRAATMHKDWLLHGGGGASW